MNAIPQADRLASEADFHDRQARGRAASFTTEAAYRFSDHDYLDHETWVRPALARLQLAVGMSVLDYGCGHGMAAVVMARIGGHVTAFDLSRAYVQETLARAAANGVRLHALQANAERLPFADGCFERIWGNAILHHLDIAAAAREIKRVLTPEGRAVFCEPWGENRLLELARRRLPYPAKHRTADERPLQQKHVDVLKSIFRSVEVEGFQLLSMARRLLGNSTLTRGLDWCDRRLLARLPRMQRYCRYVVLTLHA